MSQQFSVRLPEIFGVSRECSLGVVDYMWDLYAQYAEEATRPLEEGMHGIYCPKTPCELLIIYFYSTMSISGLTLSLDAWDTEPENVYNCF